MVVSKLFRDPQDAMKAVMMLQQRGFEEEKVGILALHKKGIERLFPRKSSQLDLLVASGPLAIALAGDISLVEGLAKALETSAEKAEYYQFGVSIGGVVVSVNTEGTPAGEIRSILKEAESVPLAPEMGGRSPGFVIAGRMSATNPIDAPLSGDFRRY